MTSCPGVTLRAAIAGVVITVALAVAIPADAYLPPATAILKRVAQRRDDLRLSSLEVRGTLASAGTPVATPAPPAPGPAAGPGTRDGERPAVLQLKVPGRCRLELTAEGPPSARPVAVVRAAGQAVGRRGLEDGAAARAMVEAVCTLLAERGGGGEPERGLAQRLADRGVDLRQVALGRMGGRVAWILGGRERDPGPRAWIDKQTFQPVRIVATLAGAMRDVRLLDFGSPVGGDAFPRAVEVWSGGQLEARFTTQGATPNPRLPDTLFQ